MAADPGRTPTTRPVRGQASRMIADARRLPTVMIVAAVVIASAAAIAQRSAFPTVVALATVAAIALGLNWRTTGRLQAALAAAESEICERAAAEARLREASGILSAILTSSPVSTQAFDLDRKVLVWNPASERLFGWAAEEVVGQSLPEAMIPLDERDSSRQRILRTLAGSTTHGDRVRRLTRDGDERWVDIYAAPLLDLDGTAIGIAGQMVDVTERVRMEAQLLQAQKMGAVGLLASGIAHDFNNTLMAARGYAELIRGSTTGRVRGDALTLIDVVDHGRLLTRQLLDFARRGDGVARVVDLRHAVIGIEPLIRRLIGGTVEIELALAHGPLNVSIQVGQLEQALLNLAINARDAMPDGGRLRVAVGVAGDAATPRDGATGAITAVETERPHRADDVEIVVSDEGIGIPAAILASVFEPFFTTKPVGAGTGLGLAMVRGFVETANGSLTIASQVGIGTTVAIRLPRSAVADS